MLIRKTFPVGPLQCNCTILACDQTKKGLVIDPGGDANKILQLVQALDIQVTAILHTHAHFDHVGATRSVYDATKAIRYVHEADMFLYQNVTKQSMAFRIPTEEPGAPDAFLLDQQRISFGEQNCEVLHTPGHTPGSCCFHFSEHLLLAAGDTLFQEGVGRTDLWGGNANQLVSSIRKKLYVLDPNTVVIPGHGPETTIGHEIRHNPYVNG